MGLERALPDPENIGSLAADDLANEFAAVPRPSDDLLDWHALLRKRQQRSIGFFPPQIAFVLELSAQVSRSGLIVVAPIAVRIARMDLRTASRKAELAFSIRCQRSATWMASGKALAAASP